MATVTITSSQNLSTVVYAADDDLVINQGVTLTITATPTLRIRSITGLFPTSKLQVTNTSTANMLRLGFTPNNTGAAVAALRFENGATCQMDGNWITIYTGTGASNQSVLANLNSVGGQLLDFLPYAEVETGSGTGIYKKWVVLPKVVTNFHRSPYGFNSPHYATGTVAVSASGAVTGTGTIWGAWATNKRFRAAGQTQDYFISAFGGTTGLTILNPDGSTYSGPTIAAGASYVIKNGSAYDTAELGSGAESGTSLWYNPLTSQITCGDGTNGLVIPNGANVRIPNIFVTSDTPSTTLSAAITGTAAAAISLTDGSLFPTNAGAYVDTSAPVGSILIIDTTSGETERIGYTSRTGNTISATGMVRGAYFTTARTHANGSVVKFIAPNTHYTAPSLDLQTGGSLLCDKVMFGNRFAFITANGSSGFYNSKTVTFDNCGLCQASIAQNFGPTGSFTIRNTAINKPIDCVTNAVTGSQFSISNCTGDLYLEKVFLNFDYSRQTQNASTVGLVVASSPNISKLTDIKVWSHRLQNNTNLSLNVSNLIGLECLNIFVTNQFQVTNSTQCVFENMYFGSGCLDPNFGSFTDGGLLVGDGCIDNVFRYISNFDNLRPSRNQLIQATNGSRDNIIHNMVREPRVNVTYNIDLKNWGSCNYISNVGTNNTLAYIHAINGRAANPISINNIGYGTRFIRMRNTNWNASMLGTGGSYLPYGGYVDTFIGPQPNLTTQSNFDIQPFTVCNDSSTATGGYLVCGPFLPEEQFNPYISGLSTTAYLTGTFEMYITTTGDSVIVSSVYAMKGVEQIDTSGTITYSGNTPTTGLTYEFRICNWGEDISLATWYPLTLTDLDSEFSALVDYSYDVGFNIQYRITATTTVATRRLAAVRVPIILSAFYEPKVSTFNLTITGLQIDSQIAVSIDAGVTWAYKLLSAGGTDVIAIDSEFNGATTALKVRIRKPGWQVLEYDLTTVDEDVSLPVEQVQVLNIEGAPVYGNGTGSTTSYISVDPVAERVDISNFLVVGEDLYDYLQDWQSSATGIEYGEIIRFDGTDTLLIGNWMLRRFDPADTDAMVDVSVRLEVSPTTNPVDEVNGSVQIFPRTVRQGSLGAIAATVWDYQTSSATTSGSMGERLKDASTVATNGQQLTAALS